MIPCFALLPIDQPSFCNSLISCLPERAKVLGNLGDQSGDLLDMRSIECLFSYRGTNVDNFGWSCAVELNRVFLKESLCLVYILESIQVKQDGFFQFPLSLRDRTTKCSRTEFLTMSYPSFPFFAELKGKDNITMNWQV